MDTFLKRIKTAEVIGKEHTVTFSRTQPVSLNLFTKLYTNKSKHIPPNANKAYKDLIEFEIQCNAND